MHVSEGQLYAATVADFSGGEPLIHREKIRTERSDLNQLNGNLSERSKYMRKDFSTISYNQNVYSLKDQRILSSNFMCVYLFLFIYSMP